MSGGAVKVATLPSGDEPLTHIPVMVICSYGYQTVTLIHFLTHSEYDRNKWKKDCGC
jgi:hypothetical protein